MDTMSGRNSVRIRWWIGSSGGKKKRQAAMFIADRENAETKNGEEITDFVPIWIFYSFITVTGESN